MLICFCHMIKTAGTTLSYIFRNNYGANYYICDSEGVSRDLKLVMAINKNIKAISGHYLKSNLKLESIYPEIKYITL